jgi:dTDP-4-dehydrorhamnose 3,5-epimerase
MKVIETKLPGVLIIEPKVFGDMRGFFLETWNHERYQAAGFPDVVFVQDNHSCSQSECRLRQRKCPGVFVSTR